MRSNSIWYSNGAIHHKWKPESFQKSNSDVKSNCVLFSIWKSIIFFSQISLFSLLLHLVQESCWIVSWWWLSENRCKKMQKSIRFLNRVALQVLKWNLKYKKKWNVFFYMQMGISFSFPWKCNLIWEFRFSFSFFLVFFFQRTKKKEPWMGRKIL